MESFQRGLLRFDVWDSGPAGGEPVVLLHGFPQAASCWSAVAPVLAAAGLRVLALDQRGYSPGARPPGRRPYRLDLLAGDVLALLSAAGVERAHIVGHDWGGAVAWALAIWHPQRVASLVSLSTPHPAALLRSLRGRQALQSWYMLAFQAPALPERLVGPASPGGRRRFVRALTASGLSPAHAEAYARRLAEPGAFTAALNWYRAVPLRSAPTSRPVAVPTLYVWGRHDRFLGERAARLTSDWVSGPYRLQVLDDAGHWLPEENAETVAGLVLSHVSGRGHR